MPIPSLEKGEYETYLGVPLGNRLTFRPASERSWSGFPTPCLPHGKNWEICVPTSYHLFHIISRLAGCRWVSLMSWTSGALNSSAMFHSSFIPPTRILFMDRRDGGLNASQLKKDADVWTIARVVQLLDSKDQVVRLTARSQLALTISRGLGSPPDGLFPYPSSCLAPQRVASTTQGSTGAVRTPGLARGRRPVAFILGLAYPAIIFFLRWLLVTFPAFRSRLFAGWGQRSGADGPLNSPMPQTKEEWKRVFFWIL